MAAPGRGAPGRQCRGPSGLAQRPVRAGLDGPPGAPCLAGGQNRAPGAARLGSATEDHSPSAALVSTVNRIDTGANARANDDVACEARVTFSRLKLAAGPALSAQHAERSPGSARPFPRPPARAADQLIASSAALVSPFDGAGGGPSSPPFADCHAGGGVAVDVGEVVRAARIGPHVAWSPNRRRSSARSRRKSSPRAV